MINFFVSLIISIKMWYRRKFTFKGDRLKELDYILGELRKGLIRTGLTGNEADRVLAYTTMWATSQPSTPSAAAIQDFMHGAVRFQLSNRPIKA